MAILYQRSKLLSVGWSSHCRHAETDALRRVDLRGKKNVSIVVLRISNGSLTMSRPCRHCILHLKKLKITTVYYSDYSGEVKKECTCDMDPKTSHESVGNKLKYNKF